MHITEAIGLAWTGIRSNKFRSFLTMLGMIIGVAAVIAMISIGDGAKESIVDSISGLGTGTITLSGGSEQMRLELDDTYYLLERSPSSSMMYPSSSSNGSVKAGTSTENYTIVGTTPEYALVQDWGVQSGSFLLQDHIDQRNAVAVIGETVSEELFEGRDPVGEKIRINGDVFEVIGVMMEKGTSMGMSTDNQIFIPITTAQRMQGSRYVNQVTFQLTDRSLNKLAMAEINVGLEEIFGDALLRDNPFNLTSMDDVMNVMDSALSTLTYLLAGIAGISLLVGGIGIMNIMLVSVTERTREIGIRKALGARYGSILSQFLIEAIIISLTGGAIGLALGSLASNLVAGIAGWSQGVSSSAIILALGFSIGVGIFFGVYPANKAAKMDPIDALRYQ